MNILVSAYACEPNKGSEPEVGWSWVTNLCKENKVFVITRRNNKENIEKEIINFKYKKNIKFIYYDLPNTFLKLKKLCRFNQIYYIFWQIGLISKIRKYCDMYEIDICHHITFATFKIFSSLAFSNKPFLFGPVGGGERVNYGFYKNIPCIALIKEMIRDIDIILAKFNPINLYTWKRASKILVTTSDTLNKIPKKFHNKCEIYQTIGIEKINKSDKKIKCKDNSKKFNILYAGNLLYWKGIYILIEAFFKFSKMYPDCKLSIIGDGKEKKKLELMINEKGLNNKIEFCGKIPRNELLKLYKKSDVFLFPSLHDSGGMVILEAMANGVPTICLKFGGPGINVTPNVGKSINARDYEDAINKIVSELELLKNNSEMLEILSDNCFHNIEKFYWENKAKEIEKIYIDILSEG